MKSLKVIYTLAVWTPAMLGDNWPPRYCTFFKKLENWVYTVFWIIWFGFSASLQLFYCLFSTCLNFNFRVFMFFFFNKYLLCTSNILQILTHLILLTTLYVDIIYSPTLSSIL